MNTFISGSVRFNPVIHCSETTIISKKNGMQIRQQAPVKPLWVAVVIQTGSFYPDFSLANISIFFLNL